MAMNPQEPLTAGSLARRSVSMVLEHLSNGGPAPLRPGSFAGSGEQSHEPMGMRAPGLNIRRPQTYAGGESDPHVLTSNMNYHPTPLPITSSTLGSAASAAAWRVPPGHVMPITKATFGSVFRPY